MTKLFALGGIGVLGAGAYAIARAVKQRSAARDQLDLDNSFDFSDLDQPVVVTEEVIVVTEAGPYEIGMELIPADELVGQQPPSEQQPPSDQQQTSEGEQTSVEGQQPR